MDDISLKIFKSLKTKKRVNEFLIFCGVIESLSHRVGGLDIDVLINKSFGDNRPVWIDSFIDNIPGFRAGNISEEGMKLVKNIENIINNANTVRVEIPFEPSEDFIDSVMSILIEYFGNVSAEKVQNIVIDIEVKEMSEPGALFFMEGKFINLTLRDQLISYLKSKDVINRYL